MKSLELHELQARYRLACELAQAGAELAFEFYQQRDRLAVDHKGDDLQDVVSVADKQVEAFVKQRIMDAFPQDGFLGEESGTQMPDARVLWVVDPIDGTSCFLNGLHTWCLSLAIVADGEPVIGVNAIAGIAGTIIAGMLSDRFFPRNRSVMAGFISLLNTAGFALMLWSPHGYYTDILAMIIFGATIGALTCFLGGLIAVDISSRKAAGAALGTIGIASYAGAGLGEFLTGIIIDKTSMIENGKTLYDFSTLSLFWVGTGLVSALFCFTTAAIVARRHAIERQTSFSS